MRRLVKAATIGVLAAGVLGGTVAWQMGRQSDLSAEVRTAPVKRMNLEATIGATGTLEPEEVVDVGAQVAGQISAFGKDKNGKSIDYGSPVEKGTVLVQIDDSLYASDMQAARAQLQQAKANEVSAEANVVQVSAKLAQAERDWDRAQKLGPSEALAPSAYDQYKANYEIAKANLGVAQAAVEQGKATVAQTTAILERAQRNLGYCTIKSPVKGVIIDRRVNIGQTVVSSLNAPSLFLIAKDLTRIQVWVSVNEADIGHIRAGMPATFTVDAFPGEVFHGQIGKIRLNASMTQNVVTYTVEVTTENPDGKLLPYLTANVQFVTGSRQNVLAVPNAALRWWPQPEQIAPEFREVAQAKPQGSRAAEASSGKQATVWVEQGGMLRPIRVNTGLTDGTTTEVQGTELAEGMQVVVGDKSTQMARGSAPGASPFTPQLGRARNNAAQSRGEGGR